MNKALLRPVVTRSILLGILMILLATRVWPDTSLQEMGKGTNALKPFTGKGKWVVVKFWVSDCHVCNQEAHQYVDFHEFHKDKDAVMLGVSLDGKDMAAAQRFIRRHQVNYPNLITDVYNGTQLYSNLSGQSWLGTPSFLVFDPSGEIRAQQAGAVPVELVEQFIEKNRYTKDENTP